MEVICYVCNKRTKKWSKNLTELKSKHSGTPITAFIAKFLDNYVSLREINDVTNCICSDCLSRIYSYDWMCMKVKEQEKEFHKLLLDTEQKFVSSIIKTEHSSDTIANTTNGQTDSADVSIEKKPVVSDDVVSKTKTPGETVKKSKPIIIRVVKRVPFLKSKPTDGAVATTVPLKPAAPPSAKPIKWIPVNEDARSGSYGKLTPKLKKVKVCEFCNEKFTNNNTFEVGSLGFWS